MISLSVINFLLNTKYVLHNFPHNFLALTLSNTFFSHHLPLPFPVPLSHKLYTYYPSQSQSPSSSLCLIPSHSQSSSQCLIPYPSLTLGSGSANLSASSSADGLRLFWATKFLSALPSDTIKSWIWTGNLKAYIKCSTCHINYWMSSWIPLMFTLLRSHSRYPFLILLILLFQLLSIHFSTINSNHWLCPIITILTRAYLTNRDLSAILLDTACLIHQLA